MKPSDYMKLKKILIIDGSPRKNGYTKKLTEFFKNQIDGTNVKIFDLYEKKISFCDGCNFCEANECCKFSDLNDFFEDFENADVIAFATPVYNGMVSAPLKILLERLQPYYSYFYKNNKIQKIKKRRKAFLIATAGRDGEEAIEFIEKQLKYTFSVTNIEHLGSALCNFTDTSANEEKAEKEILKIIERIG